MKPELIILGIFTFGVSVMIITSTETPESRGGGCSSSSISTQKKRNNKWTIKPATGDGSCLFNAVMGFLYSEKNVKITREIERNFAKTLRKDVLSFYKRNRNVIGPAGITWKELIEGDFSLPFEVYLERLTPTSAWGGQLEISAIATILNRSIYVMDHTFNIHKCYGQKIIGSNKKPIYLYYNNSHFDYLVRK